MYSSWHLVFYTLCQVRRRPCQFLTEPPFGPRGNGEPEGRFAKESIWKVLIKDQTSVRLLREVLKPFFGLLLELNLLPSEREENL